MAGPTAGSGTSWTAGAMSGTVPTSLRKALPSPTESWYRCPLWRAVLLILGVWMALCGGTLYAFSAFEVELMGRCRLSARQLDTVYACGQLGVGLGIICGVLHDTYGPAATCLYGLVLTLAGNLGLAAILRVEGCRGLGPLALLYFVLQNGSVAIYQVGLFSNLRAAPSAAQGATAGVVAAGYGLSAALASAAYAHVFDGDLERYLRGTAVVFATTAAVGALAIPRLLRHAGSRRYAHLEEVEDGAAGVRSAAGGSRPQAAAPSADSPTPDVVGRETGLERVPPSPSKTKEDAVTLRSIFRAADFWCFVATFSQLQAVGSGVFIANLGLIADSLGIEPATRLVCVRMVSYCNCAGRLLTGCLMDACEPRGIPRAAHTVWTASVLAVAAALLRFSPAEMLPWLLFPALVLVGFSYGANWAIMPSFVARRFRNAHVGVCFNLNASVMSCTVLFTSYAVGSLYDQAAAYAKAAQGPASAAPAEAATEFCRGALCWRGAFMLGLALSLMGLATAAVLARCSRLREPGGHTAATGLAVH